MQVSIIGTGNVAFHFYKAFIQSGVTVERVISRSPDSISGELKAKAGTLDELPQLESDIIILCTADDAILPIIETYQFPTTAIVTHTSGATSVDVFKGKAAQYGVFYPLQTIKKILPYFTRIFQYTLKQIVTLLSSN